MPVAALKGFEKKEAEPPCKGDSASRNSHIWAGQQVRNPLANLSDQTCELATEGSHPETELAAFQAGGLRSGFGSSFRSGFGGDFAAATGATTGARRRAATVAARRAAAGAAAATTMTVEQTTTTGAAARAAIRAATAAARIAAAAAVAAAARIAGATAATIAAMAREGLAAVAADQGDADDREKHRDAENNNSIHSYFSCNKQVTQVDVQAALT